MKKILIFLSSFLILAGCIPQSDDNLAFIKSNYYGNELKTNGYYYSLFEGKLQNISFFYKDGVYLDVGNKNNFEDASYFITNKILIERLHQRSQTGWGIFKIKSNKIVFERWYDTERGLKAYINIGKILNDTTFVITASFRTGDGFSKEIEKINETYYYKKFSPKPDSLNIYVR